MEKFMKLRQSLGVTRRQLADKAGVTYQTVWRLETGKSYVTPEYTAKMLIALSQLLGRQVTLEEVQEPFNGIGQKK